MNRNVYLLLENGQICQGEGHGASLPQEGIIAEVVFTTAMTGYLETLTDPSYFGQMVVQTFPLIGNYGVIPSDFEAAEPHLSAYITNNWCQNPSNFRMMGDLDTFFNEKGLTGVSGIDTRYLTRTLRNQGTMNGILLPYDPACEDGTHPSMAELLEKVKAYRVEKAVVSAAKTEEQNHAYPAENEKRKVVLWDFGAKENIIRELVKRGCSVTVVRPETKAEEILAMDPDGLMLSNGPGDPKENTEIIEELKKIIAAKVPMFGICLGHQLLALAHGADTVKLRFGHRGANQPVKDLVTDRIYQSSQNHGYAVDASTLPESARERFINLNDSTNEGIDYEDHPAFSVQFHPEACGGPLDSGFLFDRFMDLMDQSK